MIDDHKSFKPRRSDATTEDSVKFASPDPSISTYTNITSGHTSDQDEFHLERYSQGTKPTKRNMEPVIILKAKKKGIPGLHLVTDFSKPALYTKNLVLDQVVAKRAQPSRNRARSIVSHKGVNISNSPPTKRGNALVNIKNTATMSKRKRAHARLSYQFETSNTGLREQSPSRRSVVIGLCVSEYEAEIHNRNDVLHSAVTLVTPITPAIVITPPDTDLRQTNNGRRDLFVAKPPRRPASSMYSTMTYQPGLINDATAPPMPSIPVQRSLPNRVLQSRNPYRNMPIAQVAVIEDEPDNQQRFSEDSKEHILPRSSETSRPKSQGWWNVLSPLLSRASSLASRRGRDVDSPVPPVPPIPSNLEKQTPISVECSDPSPETPRRQGLAIIRDSTWSRWSEWEGQKGLAKGYQVSEFDKGVVEQQANTITPSVLGLEAPVRAGEGSAAEYYHACAIEQLAGISYYECVNHSCNENLPQIRSIYDVEDKEIITLGSPFSGGLGRAQDLDCVKNENSEEDNDLVTPIDSDVDDDPMPSRDTKAPMPRDEMWSPTFESDLEPDELSPNVRKANTAAVVRARALGSPEKFPTPLPMYSRNIVPTEMPNIAAVAAVKTKNNIPSPYPPSPDTQNMLMPMEGIPMNHYHQPITQPEQAFITHQTSYPELQGRPMVAPITIADLRPVYQIRESVEDRRVQNEKEDTRARKAGGLWRGRGCVPHHGCFGRGGREGRKRRRWWLCIAVILTLIVVICIVLATTLTRRGTGTPIQSQWLNLTGYPPVPTGISTIARPSLTSSENRCMSPTTMWSCALPKENQASVLPNDSNQPNLRFEITFRNGTVPANMTIPITKRADDPFTNDLFVPNPSPPSQADQVFLGTTTDNTTKPFDGEQTPFFITFMSASPVLPPAFNTSQNLVTRDLANNIPAPDLAADGSAAPATLLPMSPFPVSQPIKLYNRGLQDEHFGFYMYYDKSIFLSNIAITNSSAANKTATDPNADQNGGSLKSVANVRCTFAQTRFLVKMFTNHHFPGTLFPSTQNTTSPTSKQAPNNANTSATNFNRPGSFPYPTTMILDRHGGNLNSKLAYCYGMTNEHINVDEKQLAFEDRGFNGILINPAPGLIDDGSTTFNSSAGGIDGGTGGCGCTWQNWV